MIAYIRGKVLYTTEETAVLDVNGLGYELYCSGGAFRKLTVGETAELYTYLQVKEDGVTLFGFADNKEKELFLKIISVSGIGPKNGIAILTGISADAFAECILTADVKRLSAVKGLGKKKAENLVLELHGKISAAEVISAGGEDIWEGVAKSAPVSKISVEEEEAISALMGLGFTRSESRQAIARAKEQGATTVEDIIRKALQGSM
jgi:Holliday junction DNA helicase RuvA